MKDSLVILWTSADPITAEFMVFMYAKNAKARGWWKNVKIVIWGASAKLVAENRNIQLGIADLKQHGVEISCCVSCARELEVADKLIDLNLELIKWGVPLTEVIKDDKQYLVTI